MCTEEECVWCTRVHTRDAGTVCLCTRVHTRDARTPAFAHASTRRTLTRPRLHTRPRAGRSHARVCTRVHTRDARTPVFAHPPCTPGLAHAVPPAGRAGTGLEGTVLTAAGGARRPWCPSGCLLVCGEALTYVHRKVGKKNMLEKPQKRRQHKPQHGHRFPERLLPRLASPRGSRRRFQPLHILIHGCDGHVGRGCPGTRRRVTVGLTDSSRG